MDARDIDARELDARDNVNGSGQVVLPMRRRD
jgi:hypothetical protein